MLGSDDMEESGRPRVLIFQESLPDYRIPFLNGLGEEVELTVAYSEATSLKDVRPDPSLVNSFTLLELARSGPASGLWSWHPELLKYIRSAMPDVVIAEPRLGLFTSWVLSFSKTVKPRLIWWMSGHEPPEGGWRRTIRRFFRRVLYPRAIACIGYGSHTRGYLKELGVHCPVFVAPNAADTEGITYWAEKWEKDVSLQDASRDLRQGADFVMLFVGRMVEAKRLPLLMRSLFVLTRNHNSLRWRALLVGDGPERDKAEVLAEELDIADQVTFAGALHGAEKLITWFRAADLFVLPGKGGLALNEAISFGLPVLLTSADGTESDMVEQGVNGYILPGAGPEDLANTIARLAGDPELRERMCKASLDIASTRSNLTKMTRGFLEAINAVRQQNKEGR